MTNPCLDQPMPEEFALDPRLARMFLIQQKHGYYICSSLQEMDELRALETEYLKTHPRRSAIYFEEN